MLGPKSHDMGYDTAAAVLMLYLAASSLTDASIFFSTSSHCYLAVSAAQRTVLDRFFIENIFVCKILQEQNL